MKRALPQRWVLSFADLTLLLLAFFVMMQAQVGDRLKLAAGIRDAFGGDAGTAGADRLEHGYQASAIFEAGEAILKPAVSAELRKKGAEAARAGGRVIVASQGRVGATARLDSWELAAARTAAVARALRAGGLRDDRIEITMPPVGADETAKGQRILVQQLHAPVR